MNKRDRLAPDYDRNDLDSTRGVFTMVLLSIVVNLAILYAVTWALEQGGH